MRKGRIFRPMGEISGMSILKDEQVIEIRRLYGDGTVGYSLMDLARQFHVGKSTVRYIINKQHWRHLLYDA